MDEEEESKLGLSLGVGQCQFAPIHKLPKQQVWFHLSLQPHMKEETDIEAVEHKNNSTNVSSNTSISSERDSRKKLMLTNDQLMLLEGNFRQHTLLTPIKKNDLAEQLNLQPRQIEVWYQNRRARSKLKQKEMDCEFWKTLCESLRDENRKLKIELQDLRSRKLGSSLHVHVPPKMTPSFDKHERRKERGRPQLEECLDLITPN